MKPTVLVKQPEIYTAQRLDEHEPLPSCVQTMTFKVRNFRGEVKEQTGMFIIESGEACSVKYGDWILTDTEGIIHHRDSLRGMWQAELAVEEINRVIDETTKANRGE